MLFRAAEVSSIGILDTLGIYFQNFLIYIFTTIIINGTRMKQQSHGNNI